MFDPTVGRWTSQDPLGLGPDTNPYRYVHNAPTDTTDPTGLYETDIHFYMTYFLAASVGLAKVPTNVGESSVGKPPPANPKSAAYAIAWFDQYVDDSPFTGPTAGKNPFNGVTQFWHFYAAEFDRKIFKDAPGLLGALENLSKAVARKDGVKLEFQNGVDLHLVIPLPVKENSDEVKKLLEKARKMQYANDASFGMALHTYEDSWSHAGFMAPFGHAMTFYDGHAPDLPWLDVPRAMRMAKAVYDQLDDYGKKRGAKVVYTWADLKPKIETMMGKTINEVLKDKDKEKFKCGYRNLGHPQELYHDDLNLRIREWQKLIDHYFFDKPGAALERDKDGKGLAPYDPKTAPGGWDGTARISGSILMEPDKGSVTAMPRFTSYKQFADWWEAAYKEAKARKSIVGDTGWFGLLESVQANLRKP